MLLCVKYTKGKKPNKKVYTIFLNIKHGYNYPQIRQMAQKKTNYDRKIHICSIRKAKQKQIS